MQSIKPTQIGIQANIVPVMPTEESQADKGIDHPLVFCCACDAVWRTHTLSLCPMCALRVGDRFLLDEELQRDLMEAVVSLDVDTFSPTQEQLEFQMWLFSNLIREKAPWYDMNSRRIIQACYYDLCTRGETNPKVAVAIAFFKEDYADAPEPENTFCPEVIHFTVDAQYDLQTPGW